MDGGGECGDRYLSDDPTEESEIPSDFYSRGCAYGTLTIHGAGTVYTGA